MHRVKKYLLRQPVVNTKTVAADLGIRARSQRRPRSTVLSRPGCSPRPVPATACPGGVNADGSFTDAAGKMIETAPICISLTLRPSAFVFVAIAVIAFAALTMVLRRASDVASAIRYLDRASAAIAIVVVASLVIGQIWFGLIPITEWDGAGSFVFPFPFGSVEVDTAPMSAVESGADVRVVNDPTSLE